MHKGIKPSAQPRSLRSIAESNTGDFPADADVQPTGEYVDGALGASPSKNKGSTGDPSPFNNMRK